MTEKPLSEKIRDLADVLENEYGAKGEELREYANEVKLLTIENHRLFNLVADEKELGYQKAKIAQVKADKWDELRDPLRPLGITGDFSAEIECELKLEEASRRIKSALEILNQWFNEPSPSHICYNYEVVNYLRRIEKTLTEQLEGNSTHA